MFKAQNSHGVGRGVPPPTIDNTDPDIVYQSYFEDRYREQYMFVMRAGRSEAELWSGEAKWTTPFKLRSDGEGNILWERAYLDGIGIPAGSDSGIWPFNEEQTLWIKSCWEACLHRLDKDYLQRRDSERISKGFAST